MAAYEFVVGKTYNLSTTVPTILGQSLKSVKFEGRVGYNIARLIDNVDLIHRQVFHNIPGAVDDPSAYDYFLFVGPTGSKVAYAEPWIDHSSVELITSVRANILVEDISNSDVEIIRNLLVRAGYSPVITLK